MRDTAKPRHRGKRGGRSRTDAELRDVHSKVRGVYRALPSKDAPTGVLLERSSIRFGIAGIDETAETHVIPRKSVTVRQLLAVQRGKIETEPVRARQLDLKALGDQKFATADEAIAHVRMIETTDERMTWHSDRSLLITGTPGSSIGTFKRDGAIRQGLNTRKIRETLPETSSADIVIGPAVDVKE